MRKLICDWSRNWDTSQGDEADWCRHHRRYPHYEEIPEKTGLIQYSTEELQDELNRRKEWCRVDGCTNQAEWEGWYKTKDGFGISTGVMVMTQVCDVHKHYLGGK